MERVRFPLVVFKHPEDEIPSVRLAFRVPQQWQFSISVLHFNVLGTPAVGKKVRVGISGTYTQYIELRGQRVPEIPVDPRFPYRELVLELPVEKWDRHSHRLLLIDAQGMVVMLMEADLTRRLARVESHPDSLVQFVGAYTHHD